MASFPLPLDRRQVLAGAGGAAAATAALTLRPGAAEALDPGGRRSLRSGTDGVGSLDLRITDESITARRASSWRTAKVETSTFSLVGATWRSGRPDLRVRVRRNGSWGDWVPLRHLHDEPDLDSAEGRDSARRAVDLHLVGPSDGVQLEVAGGTAPEDLVLTLLHPDRRIADSVSPLKRPKPGDQGQPRGKVPMPAMYSRKKWGADPRLRDGRPAYCPTIKQVHVHHTVSSNNYGKAEVPGLIRSMYRYHTQSLGWSDLGYNFLVDRFGRIWVGRAGGPRRPVQGAHTLGFNAQSTGVSVIGDFQGASAPGAVLRAIARVAAWKLDIYERRPRARILVTSTGSDRFPAGRVVSLPVIDGHRDTNDTACPGTGLYRRLPRVRQLTFKRMRRFRRGGQQVPDRRIPGEG